MNYFRVFLRLLLINETVRLTWNSHFRLVNAWLLQIHMNEFNFDLCNFHVHRFLAFYSCCGVIPSWDLISWDQGLVLLGYRILQEVLCWLLSQVTALITMVSHLRNVGIQD